MPYYNYSYTDSYQKTRKGRAFAKCEKDLYDILESKGLTPINIYLKKTPVFYSYLLKDKLIYWFDYLYELHNGGLSLIETLHIVQKDPNFKNFQEINSQIIENISKGKSLYNSLADFPKLFSQEIRFMILAGENMQNLSSCFALIKKTLETKSKLKQSLWSATAYPLFLLSLIVLFSFIFILYLIPSLANNLPPPLHILLL